MAALAYCRISPENGKRYRALLDVYDNAQARISASALRWLLHTISTSETFDFTEPATDLRREERDRVQISINEETRALMNLLEAATLHAHSRTRIGTIALTGWLTHAPLSDLAARLPLSPRPLPTALTNVVAV